MTGNTTNSMEEITMAEAVTLLDILIDSHSKVPLVTLGMTSMQMKIDIGRGCCLVLDMSQGMIM